MIQETRTLRMWTDSYVSERDIKIATAKFYGYAVNCFEEWAGEALTLAEACRLLNEYLTHRSASDVSKYTTKSHRGALGVLLREAERRELCALPKRLRSVKVPDLEPVGFSSEEIRSLLFFACPMMRATILLDYSTAVRHKDLFRLRLRDYDPEQRVVRLVMSKPGKRHVASIAPDAYEACMALRKTAPADDDRFIPFAYSRETFYKLWHELGDRAGVDTTKRCLQAIRRTASSLVAREMGPAAAAQFLGHAASSGLTVFLRFYAVGRILDKAPPMPPSITAEVTARP